MVTWLDRLLSHELAERWMGGDLLLPQFGLIDGRSASGLLAMLPEEIEKVGSEP